MNDPRTMPPFGDPQFVSDLNELDREPRRGDDDASGPPRVDAPRRHRPLLDLFPPTAGGAERPPAPLLGTALPPFLPRSQTPPDTTSIR